MKKVLISLLLVLLTICLFVSCKPDPKTKAYVAKVTLNGIDDLDEEMEPVSGTFYIKRPTGTSQETPIKLYSDPECLYESTNLIGLDSSGMDDLKIRIFGTVPTVFEWESKMYQNPSNQYYDSIYSPITGITSKLGDNAVSFNKNFKMTFNYIGTDDFDGSVSIEFIESCSLVCEGSD